MRPADQSEPPDPDRLRETLSRFPIRLAVLFGSHANDTTHPFSDLDIGIVFETAVSTDRRRTLLDEITGTLVRETGYGAIDLVDISTVGPDVGYSILHDGELLFGDEHEATELENEFLQRKLDFLPVKSEWQDALSKRIREGTYGRP